jgi:dihydrolipoamide dehydrogenase
MTLPTQPKSMIIVGSGAISRVYHFHNAMGTEVTIVEFMPNMFLLKTKTFKQMERSNEKSRCVKIMTTSSVEKLIPLETV